MLHGVQQIQIVGKQKETQLLPAIPPNSTICFSTKRFFWVLKLLIVSSKASLLLIVLSIRPLPLSIAQNEFFRLLIRKTCSMLIKILMI